MSAKLSKISSQEWERARGVDNRKMKSLCRESIQGSPPSTVDLFPPDLEQAGTLGYRLLNNLRRESIQGSPPSTVDFFPLTLKQMGHQAIG